MLAIANSDLHLFKKGTIVSAKYVNADKLYVHDGFRCCHISTMDFKENFTVLKGKLDPELF